MTVTVVTPWHQLRRFIPTFARVIAEGRPSNVIVIDNGSDPPLDLPYRVIRSERNLGFSKASNLGLEAAESEAVCFLNNDVLAHGDWLSPLRDALEPGVLVGASLRSDAHAQVDGKPLAYLDGWCLAGMREDFLSLGGWDEEYEEPSYYGDNDLCLRARRAGMRLRQVSIPLEHLGNSTSRYMAEHRDQVAARNRERFMARAREVSCSTSLS